MSNVSKRIEGGAEEIGGKIKSGVGKLLGNKQMQVTGKARVLEGAAHLQHDADRHRDKVKL